MLKDERGTVLVMATLSFTAILLIMVLLLDIGSMHIMRARMQGAIDAATLAASYKTRVEVTRETRPIIKTRVFYPGEPFPPQERIRNIQTVTHWVERWVRDPNTGELVKQLVPEVAYYIVTYQDGWEVVTVRTEPVLDIYEANAAAEEVVQINAEEWRRRDPGLKFFYGMAPGVISDNRTTSEDAPTEVTYTIPWAIAWVKSLFAGPIVSFLTDNGDYLTTPVRVGPSSATARIKPMP